MAKIVEARAIITGEDRTGAAFAGVAKKLEGIGKIGKTVSGALGGSMAEIQGKVQNLATQLDKIGNFRNLHAGLAQSRQRFREAQVEVEKLGRAIGQTAQPTAAMTRSYERAQRAVQQASRAFQEQASAVSRARSALESAGIPIAGLAARQERLAASLSRTNAQFARQATLAASAGRGVNAASTAAARTPVGGAAAGGRGTNIIGGGATGLATVGAGLVGKNAYDRVLAFEQSVNAAKARGELSDSEALKLRRNARQLGAQGLGYSAKDVMELQRAYVQAGYEKTAGALARPTMEFAKTGDLDPFSAADYTVSALSAYRIKPKTEAEAVTAATALQDLLAKGANLSRVNVRDFAQGFKFAAPFAARLGVTQTQLAAMIAAQGQAGLRGDEAGIAVRSMLTRVVRPTADSRQVMAEMGMKFEDFQTDRKEVSAPNLLSGLEAAGVKVPKKAAAALPGIIQRTEKAGGDVTNALTAAVQKAVGATTVQDKAKVSKMIAKHVSSLGGGVDIERLLGALTAAGATPGQIARVFDAKQGGRLITLLGDDSEFKDLLDKLDPDKVKGASAKGASTMMQGLPGTDARLRSAYENLIHTAAESGVMDNVAKVLEAVSRGLNSLAETSPKLLEFATYAVMFAAAAGPLAAAIRLLSLAAGAPAALAGLGGGAAVAGAATGGAVGGGLLGRLFRGGPDIARATAGGAGGAVGGLLKGVGKMFGMVASLPLIVREFGEAINPMTPGGYPYRVNREDIFATSTEERAKRDADEFRRYPEASRARAMARLDGGAQHAERELQKMIVKRGIQDRLDGPFGIKGPVQSPYVPAGAGMSIGPHGRSFDVGEIPTQKNLGVLPSVYADSMRAQATSRRDPEAMRGRELGSLPDRQAGGEQIQLQAQKTDVTVHGDVKGEVTGEAKITVGVNVTAAPELKAMLDSIPNLIASLKGMLAGKVGSTGTTTPEATP